jgi:hypothetical protein
MAAGRRYFLGEIRLFAEKRLVGTGILEPLGILD